MVPIIVVVLHGVALGLLGGRILGISPGKLQHLGAMAALGLGTFATEIWGLGHLGMLAPQTMWISSGLALLVLLAHRKTAGMGLRTLATEARLAWRQDRLLAMLSLALLGLVFYSTMRPPTARDEIEYHWAGPQLWAAAGGFYDTHLRQINGPAFMEYLYTVSALWDAPTAAHLTHVLFLLITVALAGGYAQRAGAQAVVGAGVCLSIPVLVNQSSIAYSDLAALAFAAAAFAPLMEAQEHRARDYVAAGVLLAFAMSTKAFTLAAAPGLVLMVWAAQGVPRMARVRNVGLVAAAPLAFGVLWCLHTHALTGAIWDSRDQIVVHSANDPAWLTGAAGARIPTAGDLLRLPVEPLTLGILGQREPFGGRTGLLLPLLPLGLLALVRAPGEARRMTVLLLAAGVVYYVVLAPFVVKTRFHLLVYFAWIPVAALAFEFVRSLPKGVRVGLRVCFYLCLLAGMADIAHVLLKKA